ncbi:cytochrome P450 [Panus rudis PR-1116 ss-1]|nr:cytochrome P450 [Panus rudis PR-1116 ss-1]
MAFANMSFTTLVCLATLFYFLVRKLKPASHPPLPPGPRGWPVIGNALQLGRFPWMQMTKWYKQFGPIYSLNLGGQTAIVLNHYKVGHELLDKRSAIYSDRPRMIMPGEILSGNLFFPFIRYNDDWRRLRKATWEGLHPRAVQVYHPYLEREAALLVEALSRDAKNWKAHVNRAVKSAVLAVSYATPPIASETDPVVKYIDDFMHRLEHAARPGEYLVEIFPILAHLPDWAARWKREGKKAHERDTMEFMGLYRDAVGRAERNEAGPSLSALLMKNPDLSEKEAAWIAGSMFGAGASTTGAIHLVFILAMTLFPHVLQRAQQEIDTVIGRGRLPTPGDKDRLPYVRAITREVFRWRNIGPLGLPHATSEDDVYEGYFIPKGSIIFVNGWGMARDPELVPDPDNFRPERFLDETGTEDALPPYTHLEGHTAFGYGRRKCIGINIATDILFTNVATLLWAFDIKKGKDENGKEVTPDMDDFHDEGLVISPAPFPVEFVPRDPGVAEMIAKAKERTEHAHLA